MVARMPILATYLATVYRWDELAGLELRASATRLCALGGLRPLADNARQWLAALALQGHRVVLHGAGSKLLRLQVFILDFALWLNIDRLRTLRQQPLVPFCAN